MKKKWLLPLVAAISLAACSNEEETKETTEASSETFESAVADNSITITRVVEPNEDVQGVIDMTEPTTFASFIYSLSDDSYLLLNSEEEVAVTAEDNEQVLSLHIERTGNMQEDSKTAVYAVTFDHEYDTIKLLEDGEEIPFDIWTE